MLKRTTRILTKTFLWIILLVVILVGGFMLFARFHPINLTPVATKILGVVAPQTQFTFDELWFTHDGKFTLKAENVVFEGLENDNIGAIKTLSLRLSNRSIALLNPSPKHIVVEGVFYEGALRQQENKQQNISQTELLERAGKIFARLKWLKTITLQDINVTVFDADTDTQWALKNGRGEGLYYGREGLNLSIEGQLAQNNEKFAPAILKLSTNPSTETSQVSLALESLNMAWFKPYLPAPMQDIFTGKLSLSMGTAWQAKTGWKPIQMKTNLTDFSLNLPQGFTQPQTFDAIQIAGAYALDADRFDLTELTINRGATQVSLSGQLNGLTSRPTIAASGTITAGHTDDVWPWLPDEKMKRALPFLTENVSATFIAPAEVSLNGPLHELFRCLPTEPCEQIKLNAALAAGSQVKPLKQAPTIITTETGQMVWEGGAIQFNLPRATMGEQTLTNTETIIADVQTPPEIPTRIQVNSTMTGELTRALDVVKPLFKVNTPYSLSGDHQTDIAIEIPLVRGVPITIQDASLTAVVKTARAAVTPAVKGESILLTNSQFKLQDKRITGKGRARYAGANLDYNLNYALPNKTLNAKLNGNLDITQLPMKLPAQLQISGSTPVNIMLEQRGTNKPLTFDLDANFTRSNLSFSPLNWQHQTGRDLQLKAQGKWQQNNQALDLELFSLTGEGVEVGGQIYYPQQQGISAMNVQLSPIVLGNNRFNISYRDRMLSVSGNQLDLSRTLNAQKQTNINWPAALTADINLKRVQFKNGFMQGIDINAKRKDNIWQNVTLDGQLPNLVPFNLRYGQQESGYELNARTEDLGTLLTIVGISEKVRGGELFGRLTLDENYNGSGMVTLNNARFIKAPVLVQLVSLLSLEELTSGGEGINFTEGLFPLSKTGNSYRLKDAYLNGPSMALNFNGEIVPNDKYINLKGQFIPTAGINRVIDSIPILGDLLTGSQDGVLVAEFQTKGNWQKPETSVNPLKSVTPGIIKDFFRIITGGDDE